VSILKVCPTAGPAVKAHTLEPALVLSTSSLLQDLASESLLALFEQMVLSSAAEFDDLLVALRDRLNPKVGKHGIYNLAKCIAMIIATTTAEHRQKVVTGTLIFLKNSGTPTEEAALRQVQLSLLMTGDLGRMVDLSKLDGVADELKSIYVQYFDSSSEDLKQAAAYALGNASVGSQSTFLPAIVSKLDEDNKKQQYLLLSALREFIQCSFKLSGGDGIVPSLPIIVPPLLVHGADEEEGVRTMAAECLGSLTCLQPETMLKRLESLQAGHSEIAAPGGFVAEDDTVSKKNAYICWTIASSIKLALAGKIDSVQLAPFMPSFLKLLQKEELSVRNASLLMVYSAAHHMPQVVAGLLKDEIMPSLCEVSNLKLERKVDLGPFTHTVDDGIPLRKAALSIFATCLDQLPGSLDIPAFMPVLATALGDAEDIQLHAHQIVISMCGRHATYLEASVESFVEPLEKTMNKKPGTKTGTELERLNDWIKSAVRVMLALSKVEGAMNSRKFADFVERIKGNSKFTYTVEALEQER
jgi:cullin-associated NEDD8-dissociated protein 1